MDRPEVGVGICVDCALGLRAGHDGDELMLASFGALLADDVAAVITVSEGGETRYWTAGRYSTADPDEAAMFTTADDAVATLFVLRAAGVLGKSARVKTLGTWDEAAAGILRF